MRNLFRAVIHRAGFEKVGVFGSGQFHHRTRRNTFAVTVAVPEDSSADGFSRFLLGHIFTQTGQAEACPIIIRMPR